MTAARSASAASQPRQRSLLLIIAARWLTGRHWHGRPLSDATFWNRGTTGPAHWWGTGKPSRWAMLAGWQRAAIRIAVLAIGAGLALPASRVITGWVLVFAGGPTIGILLWRGARAVRLYRHRRDVVSPLAEALSPSLEMSPEETRRALAVPLDHSHEEATITAALPDGWQGHDGQRETVTRIVGHRLGGEWQSRVQRAPLALVISRRPSPPRLIEFAEVADLIRSAGSPMRPLMGYLAGNEPHWLNFEDLIVNLGVSVNTGGGKSTFLRFLVAQFAYWGAADFPVIDTKMVSLQGMETVPGVRIYDDVPAQWEAIEQLAADVDDRFAYLKANPGYQFPLCVPILEEQNDFAIASRAAWGEIRGSKDPLTPPIFQKLTRIVIRGRQVGYRTVGVYQRLTAEACGGISAPVMRDAYGGKALAFHSQQAWESLTGIRPWVPPVEILGRWVLVTGNKARQVQVPRNDAAELTGFVMSSPHLARGPLERPWAGAAGGSAARAGTVRDVSEGNERSPAEQAREALASPDSAPVRLHAAPRYLTQAEVAERLGMNVQAFIKWRQRCRQAGAPLPEPDRFAGRPAWTEEQLGEISARRAGRAAG